MEKIIKINETTIFLHEMKNEVKKNLHENKTIMKNIKSE